MHGNLRTAVAILDTGDAAASAEGNRGVGGKPRAGGRASSVGEHGRMARKAAAAADLFCRMDFVPGPGEIQIRMGGALPDAVSFRRTAVPEDGCAAAKPSSAGRDAAPAMRGQASHQEWFPPSQAGEKRSASPKTALDSSGKHGG